jgi:predicted phage replisome organizer
MMDGVKWIQLKVSMFDDEKIRLIESMPDGDTILVIWIKLLAQAGKTNANGYIFLTEQVPYSVEMLSTLFNRPISTVRLALQTFAQFGMIEIDAQDFIAINNWEKHQNAQALEKMRNDNRERQRTYRERQKALLQAPQDENEEKDNAQNEHNVTDALLAHNSNDLEREEEKEIKHMRNAQRNSSELLESQFNEFWELYGMKKDRKRSFSAFKTQVKKHGFDKIMSGTKAYLKECELKGTDKQYIKRPTTFLNGECFNDEYETKVNGAAKKPSGASGQAPISYPNSFDWSQLD